VKLRAVEKSGKTVEDAVRSALVELNAVYEDVEVEVIEEASKGFFGFLGSRPAKVRVILKDSAAKRAQHILKKILDQMELQVQMQVQEKENIVLVNMEGPDLGILIGRRGETLDALQYLVSLSANRHQKKKKKIILDIEGYRKRREETLQRLATKLADKARQRGRSVVLEPMNSQERRIIHTTLQGREDVNTFSEGEEPYRKIIISPKK
jgi:spoIIIJ-associated protein